MPRFVKVAAKDELLDGKGKVVQVEGKVLALFRVKGEYFALWNRCLHRGGPLGEGELKGYEVTCPWHGWRYDIRNGSFSIIPTLKVKTYPVKEEDNSIMVEI